MTDGFSEGTATNAINATPASTSGRSQFMPSIAVDQATGTLVVSYFDTRDDAARARYATYVTTSIDGGSRSRPDTFANAPDTAFDADHPAERHPRADPRQPVGGQPEHGDALLLRRPSGAGRLLRPRLRGLVGRPERRRPTTREPARHPGRAAANRRRPAGRQQHDGAVTAVPATVPSPAARRAVRDQRPRPGHGRTPVQRVPRAVRPRRSTRARSRPASIQVSYLAPGARRPAVLVTLTNVVITAAGSDTKGGVDDFLVTFDPLYGVGTYSYAIGPNVSDRIRTASLTGTR